MAQTHITHLETAPRLYTLTEGERGSRAANAQPIAIRKTRRRAANKTARQSRKRNR